MLKFKNFLIISALSFIAISCAHYPDVRPGANGIHRVVIPTSDTDAGSREAIEQANDYCGTMKKSAAFIDEKQAYTGSMKEEDYKKGKQITKVAKVIGGTTYVLGGKNESNAGGIVGLGAIAGDAALGNGYKVEMKFKCQ